MRSSASVSRAHRTKKLYREPRANFLLVADVGQEGIVGVYVDNHTMRD